MLKFLKKHDLIWEKAEEAKDVFSRDLMQRREIAGKRGPFFDVEPHPARFPLPCLTIDFDESATKFNARLELYNALVRGNPIFPRGSIEWSGFSF